MGYFIVNRANKLLSVSLSQLTVACVGILSTSAYADEASGLAWLQAQSQDKVTSSTIASQLQSLSETSRTIHELASVSTGFSISELQQNKFSTESLVRFALMNHFQQGNDANNALLWSQLKNRQNEDGGFNHRKGWQSNPLDTAYVLLALQETNYLESLSSTEKAEWHSKIAQALHYLVSQQREDGSYQIIKLEKLYVSSYVLSALTNHVKDNPVLVPVVKKLVAFLKEKQVSPAKWSNHANGLFVDALVAESLHPYSEGDTSIQTAFKKRAMDAQQADGSWQDDTYVTAVVLDSLKKQTEPAVNPVSPSIQLSVVDAETNLPLQGTVLTSSSDSPSQVNTKADSVGKFLVTNTQAGLYKFTLTREGYNTLTFEIKLKQGEQLTVNALKLSRISADNPAGVLLSQIQGKVTDADTSVAIANAQVTVVMVDDNNQALPNIEPIIVKTGNDGTYQAILPQAGQFRVEIKKESYFPVQGGGTGVAGGVVIFNSTLTNEANFTVSVIGKVVDEQGQPLVNTNIISNNQTIATTDASGAFSIQSLAKGNRQLSVQKMGYLTAKASLSIDKPATYDVGIIVLPKQQDATADNPNPPTELSTHAITVTAVDATTNKSVNGYTIVAEKLDANNQVVQSQSFTPDVSNPFEGTAGNRLVLAEGKWRVRVEHPAYASTQEVFTLKDKDLNYDAKLTVKPYGITATVVDSQTNNPIPNAPFKVLHAETNAQLYSGNTDANGRLDIPEIINLSTTKVYINPKEYLDTTRYLFADLADDNLIKMGEIRLRPTSAEIILPDLKVADVDASELITDQQTLKVSGNLTAKIINKGNTATDKPYTITAFEDSNFNRKLDADEQILGTFTNADTLDFQKDNADDTHLSVTLPVSGTSLFRESPIAVMVDSDSQLVEKNETNNIRYTFEGAEIKPKQGTLEAEEVWHWKPSDDSKFPKHYQLMETPMVSPLIDTNMDGEINTKDDSFIVFTAFEGSKFFQSWHGGCAVVRAINLRTRERLWETKDGCVAPASTPAIADIDADGKPEIVLRSITNLVVYNNDGSIKINNNVFRSQNAEGEWSIPALADLDKDGYSEIIYGEKVFNHEGNVIHDFGSNRFLQIPIISSLGGDDTFVFRNDGVYNARNYQKKFSFPYPNTSSAIIDANVDGEPEIVAVGSKHNTQSYLNLLNSTGASLWSVKIPKSNIRGGAPTVGDFDSDGTPDMGVAGTKSYSVFRSDGSLIWSYNTKEGVPDVTGSSLFDFDNDGDMEVLYADEFNLHVFDGKTGEVLMKVPNTSGTVAETPIVVDADKDGHADIILISSDYHQVSYDSNANIIDANTDTFSIHGFRMFSSANKDWANTRSIWNQHSYHVTNINDDLTIPKNEPNSWEVHNTYRANLLIGQNATAAADLTTSYIRVSDSSFIGDSTLTARIGNAGGKPVKAGTPISFYRIPQTNGVAGTPELVQTTTLTKDLVGGNIAESYEDVTITYADSLADFGELVVVANDAGAGLDSSTGVITGTEDTTNVIQEYRRDNNTARLAIDGGWTSLTLDGSVDKTAYGANADITITAIPANLGSFPSSPTVKTEIIDSAGNVIATLDDQAVDLTSALIADPDNSKTLTQIWNTGTHRTGNYIARISLYKDSSIFSDELELVTSIDRPFSVVADGAVVGLTNSSISTDKASYLPNDIVQINSRIQNTASNQVANRRDITVEIKDADGQVIFNQSYGYDELAPNALKDQPFQVSLQNAKAGTYTVTQTTIAPDGSQSTQVNLASFSIADSSQTGVGIVGAISVDNPQVELGSNVNLNWSINNTGDVNLTQLPMRIELFKNDSDTAFANIALTAADIAQGSNISQIAVWNATEASLADGDQITAILVAGFTDDTGAVAEKGLAVTNFTLVEPPIDVVINPRDTNSSAPLLVYYSCEEGWKTYYHNTSLGHFDFPCFDERANVLTSYLNRINVPYKLVKQPKHFADQLQSGLFEQVWILGAVEDLKSFTRKEVTELTHAGDNLVMDSGMNSWLNQNLYPLAGATFKSRLLLQDGSMTLAPSFMSVIDQISADNTIASTPLVVASRSMAGHPYYSSWAVQLQPQTGSSVWSSYQGQIKRITSYAQEKEPLQDFPAIISQKYGNGYPVALGFDLINSLDQASKASITDQTNWEATLKTLLASRTIQANSDYVPQDVVNIPLSLHNKGANSKQLTVTVDLPVGATWLGHKGGVTTTPYVQDQDSYTYTVTLSAKQQLTQSLTLRLPKQEGTQGVRVTVQDANTKKVLEQLEMRYLIRDINSRFEPIRERIKGWNVLGVNGIYKLAAKDIVFKIHTHLKTGAKQLAVYEATKLATTFKVMQAKDTSNELTQLRYEADELLRALQIDWYIDRDGYVPPM